MSGARPFFIVSSGRSGTAMLTKVLGAADDVTIEHEYMVQIVQRLAVRRYQGLIDSDTARSTLSTTHGAALRFAQTGLWGDSSNKLSWLIPDLAALFPEARFIHLVRDGRKVAGSYFHKLGAECYDDRSTTILAAHLKDPARNPAPPPEKKYWWPQPKADDPWAAEFTSFGQFERICWHWAEINRVIQRELGAMDRSRRLFLKLENLRHKPAEVAALFAFLDLPYRDEHFALFARPHNVNKPVDRLLNAAQTSAFHHIAGSVLADFGYAGLPEYSVNY